MAKSSRAFTLVELLIVIVVIAILAAVTFVAYNGLQNRANDAAAQTDIANATKKIKLFYSEFGKYPTAIQCPEVIGDTICAQGSGSSVFNYSANNSATPPTYSLTLSRGSIRYTATQSSGTSQVTTTPVKVTNFVTNGDFSNGLNGFTNYCASPAVCAVNSGVLTLTVAGSNRAVVSQYFAGPYTDQDKIYYSLSLKKASGSNFTAAASRDNGGYDTAVVSTSQFNNQPANSTQRYSVVRTFLASQGSATSMSIGQYSYNTFSYDVQVDDIVAINLTKDFGAGKEPTAAQMDAILATVPNGWFGGTTTVYK